MKVGWKSNCVERDRPSRGAGGPEQPFEFSGANRVVRGRTPREVLNEIRFRHPPGGSGTGGLDDVEVAILHRAGREDTCRRIAGKEVLRLERGFFYISGRHGETAIPYHRVRSISWKGAEVWRRP